MADITYLVAKFTYCCILLHSCSKSFVSIISLYFWCLKHTSCLKICYGLLCPDLQWLQSLDSDFTNVSGQNMNAIYISLCRCVGTSTYKSVVTGTHKFSSTLHSIKSNQLWMCDIWCLQISVHTGSLDTWMQKWDCSHSSSVVQIIQKNAAKQT